MRLKIAQNVTMRLSDMLLTYTSMQINYCSTEPTGSAMFLFNSNAKECKAMFKTI